MSNSTVEQLNLRDGEFILKADNSTRIAEVILTREELEAIILEGAHKRISTLLDESIRVTIKAIDITIEVRRG